MKLMQVEANNISKHLLKEFMKNVYSLYQTKENIKKVSNSLIDSIQIQHKLDTMLMNFKSGKTSDIDNLELNLADKIDLKTCEKYIALSNLSIS